MTTTNETTTYIAPRGTVYAVEVIPANGRAFHYLHESLREARDEARAIRSARRPGERVRVLRSHYRGIIGTWELAR